MSGLFLQPGAKRLLGFIALLSSLGINLSSADQPTVPLGEGISLPYGFYSEHFGLAAG